MLPRPDSTHSIIQDEDYFFSKHSNTSHDIVYPPNRFIIGMRQSLPNANEVMRGPSAP